MNWKGNSENCCTTIYKTENIDGVNFLSKSAELNVYGYYKDKPLHFGLKYDEASEVNIEPVETDKEKVVNFIKRLLINNMKEEMKKKEEKPRAKLMHFSVVEGHTLTFSTKRDIGDYWKKDEKELEDIINNLHIGEQEYEPKTREDFVGAYGAPGVFEPIYMKGYIKEGNKLIQAYRSVKNGAIYRQKYSWSGGEGLELCKPAINMEME